MATRTRTTAGTLVPLPLGTRAMPKVVAHGDRSRRMVGILLSHTRASLRLTMQKNTASRYADADADAVPPSRNLAALDVPRRPIPILNPGAARFPRRRLVGDS